MGGGKSWRVRCLVRNWREKAESLSMEVKRERRSVITRTQSQAVPGK